MYWHCWKYISSKEETNSIRFYGLLYYFLILTKYLINYANRKPENRNLKDYKRTRQHLNKQDRRTYQCNQKHTCTLLPIVNCGTNSNKNGEGPPLPFIDDIVFIIILAGFYDEIVRSIYLKNIFFLLFLSNLSDNIH